MGDLERGRAKYDEVYGEGAADRLLAALDGWGSDIGRYGVEFNFGEIYSRPGLDLRQRQIASIAALVTLGGVEPQLTGHIKAGLNVGLSPTEIVETIIHCVQYAGFPRTINAINVAKKVFQERGVT
ncbi:4-carboxymuconolactone decarboxylase [Thermocatellispora tengchongensis]|uniref:4-carboxymuconolactone decarboxylase n=1 Tax=Thermocatellispora tengchongensis TaxID=1073253 RepID=A0A840PBI0_9ACTN|nr:carboxymuconolactone decarboxylase family protein [Thermocatellispora tengchongensis]MBB5135283.1 4-carboxymuconolactone decarboxylase [Thermocatellispora tengchongensis]